MAVRVILHLEALDDGRRTWWAESPELPAFSATDASLRRLADLCEEAVAENVVGGAIEWCFAGGDEADGAPGVAPDQGQEDASERVQIVQHFVPA